MRLLLLIASLGYFVDIVDLFLFNVLRIPSLSDLGVPKERWLSDGALILNCQAAGMLLGSFVWGVLGDKRGRVAALYGSIALYSFATLASALIQSVPAYAVCRFIAGFGLAGELGAAITLVAETLPARHRGYGTALVAGVGLCGGAVAAWMAETFAWRTCYAIGGGAGLLLLALRWKLRDSALFLAAKDDAFRGSLRLLFLDRKRFALYARFVAVGVPIYFVSAILMVFAPEISEAIGVRGTVTAARAIFYSYLGVALGDLFCGLTSQVWKNRKRAILVWLLGAAVFSGLYLSASAIDASAFYAICFFAGIFAGYWAVLITSAAEAFGTNLRATVTTTIPNLIRASTILLTLTFQWLLARLSMREAAVVLGVAVFASALFALRRLPETYGRNLAFIEKK